jgi:hypothetical protein
VQDNGNNFAHAGRPATAALDDTLKTFNEMLDKATIGPFPSPKNKKNDNDKLPNVAVKLIKAMAKEVQNDLENE